MNDAAIFTRGDSDVKRAGGRINDGRTADADLRRYQGIGRLRNRRNPRGGIDEATLPEGRGQFTIAIKGIHAGVFRGYINDIMLSTGYRKIRYI